MATTETAGGEIEALALRTGKEIQLLIAASRDLPGALEPLRAKRARKRVGLAAGVGGATSAVVGAGLLAANIGFWASVGAALGLASIPLLITLAGGGLAIGLPRRRSRDPNRYARERSQVELTYCCFSRMAEADGRISDEERLLLRAVLLEFPLEAGDRQAVQEAEPERVLTGATGLDPELRRQVLQGTWMLAEADGVSQEEEALFEELCRRLGLPDEAFEIKRRSRDQQAALNDLVTAMFRTCQQVLAPSLGAPAVSDFLEALAQIAATPQTRRSLRNSIKGGFSAGGVVRALDEHGEAGKLIAQAMNGVRSVHGGSQSARKEARTRLLALAESSAAGPSLARKICADIDALFEEALGAALRAERAGAAAPR
jgi:DnaJ-domain-containing protein 1